MVKKKKQLYTSLYKNQEWKLGKAQNLVDEKKNEWDKNR